MKELLLLLCIVASIFFIPVYFIYYAKWGYKKDKAEAAAKISKREKAFRERQVVKKAKLKALLEDKTELYSCDYEPNFSCISIYYDWYYENTAIEVAETIRKNMFQQGFFLTSDGKAIPMCQIKEITIEGIES